MDLLLASSPQNIETAAKCIGELGFDGLTARKVLLEPAGMLFLKEEPYRVDLLTKINLPESFDVIFERAETRHLFDIEIKVIGYADLINEKARSKRDKDLQDIYKLEEIKRTKR